jgi:hypothetical protein
VNTRIQLFAILTILLSLCGCITSVSHKPPFNQYLGRTLTTQRTTILYRDGAWDSNAEMLFSPPKQVLYLIDKPSSESDYRYKNRVAILPAGQELRLLDVRQEVGDGIVEYDAIGEVYVPAWKRFVRFHHAWGYYGKLHRAPWDSAATPSGRSL